MMLLLRTHGSRLLAAAALLGALLMASCALPSSSINSPLVWPFDTGAGSWTIENGYNTGPDHMDYELDSLDFQRAGGTTGQTVLSPVSGNSVAFGRAYPFDGTSGQCVSISIDGQSGYHLMVCHITNPVTGAVTQGGQLGTVSGGRNGNHIHITLYYLDPSVADTAANASQRQATPFSGTWSIAGCSYPATGKVDEYGHDTPVPCGAAGSGTTTQANANVAGNWQYAGPGSPPTCGLSLEQNGAAISGDVTCYYFNIGVSGSVSGNQISFQGNDDIVQGGSAHYQFSGTINNGATNMHGNVVVTSFTGSGQSGQSTWSATRSK